MRSALHVGVMVGTMVVGAALTLGACSGDDTGTTTGSPSGSPTGGGPSCEPTAACTEIKSDCMALIDNSSAAKATLRFSQLTITGPKQLASGLVASTIAKDVLLDDADCNLAGAGT